MPRFRRFAALTATTVILVLGFRDGVRLAFRSHRIPPCSDVLAPLQVAPIPAGATAAIIAPARWRQLRLREPLSEAIFRRPDVHWLLVGNANGSPGVRYLVTIDPGLLLTDWHPIWRRGEVTVLVSDR
ncbi:MAG: hypothetical protein LAO05_01300 [Acidobacteriia bacterium]|nr:hypothetical protein [Terriglobia bacterium]